MAIATYRKEIFTEDGYVISNADVPWESMPQKVNINAPGLRVYSAPIGETGQIVVDIDEYVEPNDFAEDVTPDFKTGYLKALHGQLAGWKLMAVKISKGGYVCLAFINVDTWAEEDLYIKTSPYLRVMIEKQLKDDTIEKTLLTLSSENGTPNSTMVTEYLPHGKNEIQFEPLYGDKPHPDENWSYIYVTEYR